jgi:hypothetical protein
VTDYRDIFEQQMVQASRRLSAQAPAPRRRRLLRPAFAVPAALVVFAGTGVAAVTHPWSPTLGDPSLSGPAPTITPASPPAEQISMLSVLRRHATRDDRDPATKANLKYLNGSTTTGVETDYIRRLSSTADGAAITLIPIQSWRTGTDAPALTDALCIVYPDAGGRGAGKACFDAAAVRAGQATGSIGGQTFGLVPDAIKAVEATYPGGAVVRAAVHDNFFSVSPTGSSEIGGPGPSRPDKLVGLDQRSATVLHLTR